jgi:uncharacterized MnhB-related membrane protein
MFMFIFNNPISTYLITFIVIFCILAVLHRYEVAHAISGDSLMSFVFALLWPILLPIVIIRYILKLTWKILSGDKT